MVAPYLVHYPSRDGKWTISAFAYVPNNIQRNAKFPAIVYIHGGPAAQSMDSFNRFIQYIVNQGYLVIAPNYRGSTGYGKEFTDANLGDAGGQELNDVLDAADWIKKSGFVDPKKLIVMGGSYGGYLSMMAVTKAPDMWAAARAHRAIRELVHRDRQRRPQPARVRSGDDGRSGEEQGAV